jgi:predicted nucleic acid binding AN1-type Zn finger protein
MKCTWCKKKAITLKCKGCGAMFCTSDIQLEIHCCIGLEDVKRSEIQKLKDNLPKVVATKVQLI